MVDLFKQGVVELHAEEWRPTYGLDQKEDIHSLSNVFVPIDSTEDQYAEKEGNKAEDERNKRDSKHEWASALVWHLRKSYGLVLVGRDDHLHISC